MKRSRRHQISTEEGCPRESKAHHNDGVRLKIIRRRLDKTQTEFATELGISVSTLANYENARTEMSPSFARAVLSTTGMNPVPPDPEEDPKLLLQQKDADAIQPSASIFVRILRLRRRCIAKRNELYSPMRRMVDDAIHCAFSIAAFVFAGEQLMRLPSLGAEDPGSFRDVSLVVASLTMVVLFLPVVQGVPWGMREKPSHGN